MRATIYPIYYLLLYSRTFSNMLRAFPYPPQKKILKTAMDFVAHSRVEGDYLEFGVYRGKTFVAAFYFAQHNDLKSMKFYAFDSFKGLPRITGIDANGFRHFSNGQYSCSVDGFKKIISRKGVDLAKVEIVSGWFDKVLNEETKKNLPLEKASIIWIDCNLYESTVPVLNFITDYLQDGTLIIFDDWFCFRGNPDRGERKAFGEWLEKNPSIKATEYRKFGSFGNSFIIHKE